MTNPTYLAEFAWLRTSPLGFGKAHINRVKLNQLGDPENALLLQLFLDYLGYYHVSNVGTYRTTLTSVIVDEPPEGWGKRLYDQWREALDRAYTEFKPAAVKLRELCSSRPAKEIRQALSSRMAGELAANETDSGIAGWVDAVTFIGRQIDLKEEVKNAVNAFVPFERLGWTKAKSTIDDNIGTALDSYGEREKNLRQAVQAYQTSGTEQRDDARTAMMLALLEYTESSEALGRSIYDTAKVAVDWAKDKAKDIIKDNMSTEHKDLSDGLLTMSTCVFVISGALGAVGMAFPPAAIAGGLLATVATGVKWLIKDVTARRDVKNRDKVKEMLTVQFAGSEGNGQQLVETLTTLPAATEKGKLATETLSTVTAAVADKVGSSFGKGMAEGMNTITDPLSKPMAAIGPLVSAAELSLEYLEADAKQKNPKYNPQETNFLLACVDYAYNRLDPSTSQVNRSKSLLRESLGDNRYRVTVVGSTGTPVTGIVDGATNTFQPDHRQVFTLFSKLVPPEANPVSWYDENLGATVTAQLDLSADKCTIGDYDAVHGCLAVELADVYYTATLPNQSEPVAEWREVRPVSLYANGEIDVPWAYAQTPYIAERLRNPRLLDEDYIDSDDHPYRPYVELNTSEMGRVVAEKYAPPDEERADFNAWKRALQAKLEQEDREFNARVGDALDRGGY